MEPRTASVDIHRINVVVTSGPELHAKHVERYALTGAVFRLQFDSPLAAFAVGGLGPEQGPHGPGAILPDGSHPMSGALALSCEAEDGRTVDMEDAPVQFAHVYDQAPMVQLRWTPVPLAPKSTDPLASAFHFADRQLRGAPHANETLRLALLLHYEDEKGAAIETSLLRQRIRHPAASADPDLGRAQALARAVRGCSLRALGPHEQRAWPVRRLRLGGVDVTGAVWPACVGAGAARVEPSACAGPLRVHQSTVLKVERIDKEFTLNHAHNRPNAALWRYPQVASGWRSVVPPLPRYCGLQTGTLSVAQAQTLRGHHESVFLESAASFSIPGLSDIMNFATNILMAPLLDPLMDEIKEHFAQSGGAQTAANNQETVPKATAQMTEPAVRVNVTNLVTDSVTAKVTQTVAKTIAMDVAPRVVAKVEEPLRRELEQAIPKADVIATMTAQLEKALPSMVARSLPIFLADKLTRSLTHALTPTLTLSLTHTSHQHYWCHMCYTRHVYCNFCHDSPQSQYYTSYYATYYADYYAEYFTPYYVDSLVKIDKAQHPPDQQEAARKENQEGPEQPLDRPMTAS